MKTRIENAALVLPNGCEIANLEISDGKISYIGLAHLCSHPDQIINARGRYVLAGFIDLHSNGLAGFDLVNGRFHQGCFSLDEQDYLIALEQAANAYAATGVTRVLSSSIAAPLETLQRAFHLYAHCRQSGQASAALKNIFAGLYVEGTFIKEPAFRGAHNAEYFYEPSVRLFEELQAAADGLIRIVNVPPEWEEPARKLMGHLQTHGIVIAAGHTAASGACYERAISQGLKLAIHLFNGPTGSSFKSFDHGAALETILRSNQVMAELITDGFHVDPAYVLDAIRRKGPAAIIAVTDSMFAAQLKNLNSFSIFGVEGQVSSNGRFLQVQGREHTLFGSLLTMDQAFANLVNWFTHDWPGIWYENHKALAMEEALVRASALCSGNPAELMGWRQTGSIEIGKQADLIIADIEELESEYRVKLKQVFCNGAPMLRQTGSTGASV